jgi:hypothetical protein
LFEYHPWVDYIRGSGHWQAVGSQSVLAKGKCPLDLQC